MHRKSWKSRLDPKIMKLRREQLDSLLALANGDFTTGRDLESGIAAGFQLAHHVRDDDACLFLA